MNEVFVLWDQLFQELAMQKLGFLQSLTVAMTARLVAPVNKLDINDAMRTNAYAWLEHIYTSIGWHKVIRCHGAAEKDIIKRPREDHKDLLSVPMEKVEVISMGGREPGLAGLPALASGLRMASLSVVPGHGGFVQPSSYLRPQGQSQPMTLPKPESAVERDQRRGLRRIRDFLKARTSYDVLPLSFRLIVFDTSLLVKKSLSILIQNGIVSAPLWDSKTSTFAGLLTNSDYINLIQYYWQNPDAVNRIDQFKLNSLRDIERAIGVSPLETASIHPTRPLYEACRRMLETRARRIPLVDTDDETGRAMVVSVVTQYRILKFVAVNVHETQLLRKPLRHLKLGTYKDLVTASMETSVFELIHKLVHHNISSIPILNSDGVVTNVFEAVDVIALIKGANYDELNLNAGEALQKRSEDFPGIFTCSIDDRLDTIFDTIRKSRVHRLVVIDEDCRLVGVLTLSDILEYILLEGEGDDSKME
ncbi:MAG: hypothetical protein Q9184_000578 [Pyrenodesmia sp. 2 TL-2023]